MVLVITFAASEIDLNPASTHSEINPPSKNGERMFVVPHITLFCVRLPVSLISTASFYIAKH